MTGSSFDTLALSTIQTQGRRQALQAIGAAALAAAGAPLLAAAKRNKNNNGNRNNNGNGNNNKKNNKDKKRCKKQVGVCEQEVRISCGNDAECVARQLPCCQPLATCNIQEFFDCLQQQ